MSEQVKVVIVGGGVGGVCAAIKVKEAGFDDFLILEKDARLGGVWHQNKYPGCACDVPVALYQYSFAQSANWTRVYPSADEIQAYIEEIAERYGLGAKTALEEGVESATWDKTKARWQMKTTKGRDIEAEFLISALGQLNRPAWPDIPGRDAFKGQTTHTARWDESISLKGKRVGMIGAAASAVQVIPEIAPEVAQLNIFQRTPNWVIPRNDRPISPEERALFMTQPEMAGSIGARNRQLIYDNADYFFWQAFESTEAGRAAYTRIATEHLHAAIPPGELRDKLTPDYPIGCKRILITDDFYPTMRRDNVSLITEGIDKIDATGLTTQDGAHHDLDVLVFATGFETTKWHWSMEVKGLSGKSLNEVWAKQPQAYLGVGVHDFPNLFMLYGPNTNLGHNSIIVMLEAQANYIAQAVQTLSRHNADAMMPDDKVQAKFNAQLQKDLKKRVWADPNCQSWYKNEQGVITQNWSSHTRDYNEVMSAFRPEDYQFLNAEA